MINYVVTERFSSPIAHFLRNTRRELAGRLRFLTYEELFFERAGPIGHYIFTDLDRLGRYELDTAARFAAMLRKSVPDARILNDPARALERTALLVALHRAHVNDFTANRLDTGERPSRFPVFIRPEDGHHGPETDLIEEADFDRALADLRDRGVPLRGRVAIGFAAEKGPNGRYRKYGAFNIAGTVVSQHLIESDVWAVRRRVDDKPLSEAIEDSAGIVEEELDYIRSNPHRDQVRRAFEIASIEYGRADYGVVNGRLQFYEINTNPQFPGFQHRDHRTALRGIIREHLVNAFRALDTPLAATGTLYFEEKRPRAHNVRLPRLRLPISFVRRAWRGMKRSRKNQAM